MLLASQWTGVAHSASQFKYKGTEKVNGNYLIKIELFASFKD